MKLNNKYYIIRHGEALSNVKDIVSCWPEKFKNPLTTKGREQIKKASEKIKSKNIDLIFSSPLLRTKQTAGIVGKFLKIMPKFDKRLREIDFGIFNSKSAKEFVAYFESEKQRVKRKAPKGENYIDVSKRVFSFLKDAEKKYKVKNILIISHQAPLLLLEGRFKKLPIVTVMNDFVKKGRIKKGELIKLN